MFYHTIFALCTFNFASNQLELVGCQVVVSPRVETTPCILVTSQYGNSANMERIMQSQVRRGEGTFGVTLPQPLPSQSRLVLPGPSSCLNKS
jgi:hypothetical protein